MGEQTDRNKLVYGGFSRSCDLKCVSDTHTHVHISLNSAHVHCKRICARVFTISWITASTTVHFQFPNPLPLTVSFIYLLRHPNPRYIVTSNIEIQARFSTHLHTYAPCSPPTAYTHPQSMVQHPGHVISLPWSHRDTLDYIETQSNIQYATARLPPVSSCVARGHLAHTMDTSLLVVHICTSHMKGVRWLQIVLNDWFFCQEQSLWEKSYIFKMSLFTFWTCPYFLLGWIVTLVAWSR